ncbi:MAG: EAL domain-containing protein [Halothiobacillaceae bacterium]|nr:EAL domain-containing protein [Halothiobacillaceae bacterium]
MSGVSLNDDKFIDNLFHLLGRHSQLTRRLCIEITEGVALQNLERTRQLISRLRKMGARIALDDFGAGYTSFSYLKQLGADALKIDGTLVRDMLASETNIAIVRTIVELAQNLGMTSIAEWVEDAQTLEALREMGVDFVQGYVVSAALTPMEILDAEALSDLVSNPETLSYIRRNSPPPTLTLLG